MPTVRQLGAVWWSSAYTYAESHFEQTNYSESFIRVGWPAGGGVWVLQTTLQEAMENGAAIIHMAYNMEERCKAIEKLRGVFYANPKDCPYLDLP